MSVQIRQSGGSKIVSLPTSLLRKLGWDTGQELEMELVANKLVIHAANEELSLEALLEGCTPEALAPTAEDREWLDMPSVGKEF